MLSSLIYTDCKPFPTVETRDLVRVFTLTLIQARSKPNAQAYTCKRQDLIFSRFTS